MQHPAVAYLILVRAEARGMKTRLVNLLLAITAAAVAAADQSASVKLDFHNADVNQVLSLYESLTHLKLIRDNFVDGKMTVAVAEPVTPEKAVEIIERTLFANNYQLTQIDSDTVEVTGTGRTARSIGVPVIRDPKALPTRERLVSFVFVFKHRHAQEMRKSFAQYLSPPQPWTSFFAEPKSNTLLVTERTSVIRTLIDIAAKMDVPDWKKQNISSPQATVIAAAIASLFVVVGWIATHALTLKREREARAHADRREKEARRAELLATLHFWLQTLVVETDPNKLKQLYYFGGAMKELSAAAARFRGWVTDRARFDQLNNVSNMNPEALDAGGVDARRDTVCHALLTFIEFVRDA